MVSLLPSGLPSPSSVALAAVIVACRVTLSTSIKEAEGGAGIVDVIITGNGLPGDDAGALRSFRSGWFAFNATSSSYIKNRESCLGIYV